MEIAGLVGPDDRVGLRQQIALNFDLRVVECAVDDLRLEGHASAAFPAIVEPHPALQPDFALGNGIGILHPDRPVRVQVIMVQGESGDGPRARQDYQDQSDCSHDVIIQWRCSRSFTIIGLVASALAR